MVMIRIGFGRKKICPFFAAIFNPPDGQKPEPDVMEFFFAKKVEKNKSVQNWKPSSQCVRNRLGNMI